MAKKDGEAVKADTAQKLVPGFLGLVRLMGEGTTRVELDERLKEVIEAVRNTGKGGSLSLTIKISGKAGAKTVQFVPQIRVAAPEPDSAAEVLYVSEACELSQSPFKQETMNFKRVAPAPAEETPAAAEA